MARRASQLDAEAKIPIASENRNVSSRTSTIRQNSPLVMPPISSGTARTGKIANSAKKPFKIAHHDRNSDNETASLSRSGALKALTRHEEKDNERKDPHFKGSIGSAVPSNEL